MQLTKNSSQCMMVLIISAQILALHKITQPRIQERCRCIIFVPTMGCWYSYWIINYPNIEAHLHFCVSPSWDLYDHVKDVISFVMIKWNVVPR